MARCADEAEIVINPIVYSEVSIGFDRIEDVEAALPREVFVRSPLPWDAAFLAGECFQSYKRRGGQRRSPLTDFYIGAHRTYIPWLTLVAPSSGRGRP